MRRAGWLLALALAALSGCVTTPLEDRSWVRVRTAHHDIWSSLGEEETRRLSIAVERFRAATEFLWDGAIPPAPVRTRIYAFDDRGIGRPFAFGSDRSYLLPRQDGDVIVLRTGDGWEGDARTALKLDYARRLVRSDTPDRLPPWLPEGAAQLASTLESRGQGASVGIPRRDHVELLREAQWVSFDRVLAATDLSGWSERERALFEAESWALLHYLRLSDERRGAIRAQLERFRERIDRGAAPAEAASSALGEGLQRQVWRHVTAEVLPSLSVRIQRKGEQPELHPVSRREILEQLGWLALGVDAREPARRYLEAARELAPASPRALAGLAELAAREGDAAEAEAGYRAALDRAPDDPAILVAWADRLRERAAGATDPAERGSLVVRARAHYQRALDVAPELPAAHAGIAASFLVPGEDPSLGIAPARRARELLPGDAATRILGARLALAMGDPGAARAEAVRLMTQARSTDELRDARSLLEEIDSRVTPR